MSDRSAEAGDRYEPDGPVVPPAHAGDAGSLAGCLIVAALILLPALLYFGLFAAILVDELVLQTNWILGVLPESAIEFLRAIYTPLIWLMDQFDG